MDAGAARFQPPRWLRNPHLQSVLGASPLRGARGQQRLREAGGRHQALVLDAGGGVRLQGVLSQPVGPPRALALLLHGWEGSIDSSYMRLTAARLLADGLAVFRLNFRDHGGSHALNEGIFHSNRIDEVVGAALALHRRWPQLPLMAAGFSLGGNFALRLALRAPAAGLPLQRVAAVCPVLDPARTMAAMETGPAIYRRHFEQQWRASLSEKRRLFPHVHRFGDDVLHLGMRDLTAWMVDAYTDLGGIDAYFDGYSLAGDRLAQLQVPASILMAADDPVVPLDGFERLRDVPGLTLELTDNGGHCGFIDHASLDGYAERRVADWLGGR